MQEKDKHINLALEYAGLANRSELSELEAERMSELLEMAQSDDVLSLLFNEIDCCENPKINNRLPIDDDSFVNVANDNFLGGFGNDILEGGDGNDYLYGGAGDDYPPVNHSRNYPRLCQVTSGHKHLIKEYSELANLSELSELEAERMSELLEMAQSDDVLSLLFNEIDCSEITKINNRLPIDDDSFVNLANDNFLGYFGNDILDGGTGIDYLDGGTGNDRLYGEEGNEYLYGEAGDYYLEDNTNNDRIYGEDGNNYIFVQGLGKIAGEWGSSLKIITSNHSRNYPPLCQLTSEHKHLIKEYSELANSSELSEPEAERMSELLEMAQLDDVLSLLFNEIDCCENTKISSRLLMDDDSSVDFANDNFIDGFGHDILEGDSSVLEEESPVLEEEPPIPEEKPPVLEEESPISGEEPPVSEEEPPIPEEESPIPEEELPDVTDGNIIDASGGNKTITVEVGDKVVITNFTGVGSGTNPSLAILEELDTVQFVGEGLEAESLLFLQEGEDLVLSFEGDTFYTSVVLQGVQLEDIEGFDASEDVINAGQGNDRLEGLSGDDFLRGEEGNDTLFGGLGDDKLVGGSGDDLLDGGTGNNTYTGGAGSDQFMLSDVSSNLITDFTSGEDQLIVSDNFSINDLQIELETSSEANRKQQKVS